MSPIMLAPLVGAMGPAAHSAGGQGSRLQPVAQ